MGFIHRLPNQDARHAVLLKLAALLNFLSGAIALCETGAVLPQGTVKRMADEAAEDVLFLTTGLLSGMSDRHAEFLDYFWREDVADFDDRLNSFQSRPQVKREKVIAAIHRISDDPSTATQVGTLLSKAYSGFVHAAAPHVMDIYDPERRKFEVLSASAQRRLEHEIDLWNQMYRGAGSLTLAAKVIGTDADFNRMKAAIAAFEQRTNSYGQAPPCPRGRSRSKVGASNGPCKFRATQK